MVKENEKLEEELAAKMGIGDLQRSRQLTKKRINEIEK
jgi:hypothetical protein